MDGTTYEVLIKQKDILYYTFLAVIGAIRIATTTEWSVLKDIHGSQNMKPNDFKDLLTFAAPPAGDIWG